MNISYNNKQEQKQILDILLNLGYLFHGKDKLDTSDAIINQWGSQYTSIEIGYTRNPRSIQLTHSTDNPWIENYKDILSKLENFRIPPHIRVNDVGDYSAIVTKDNVSIYDEKITPQTLKSFYELTLESANKKAPVRMDISISDLKDLRPLLGMLYGLGCNSSRDTLDATIKDFTEAGFKSIVIAPDKHIGANYEHDRSFDELFFPKDTSTIINNLTDSTSSIECEPIGTYNTSITPTDVLVGCQTISHEKVKEIYDALVKLGAFE